MTTTNEQIMHKLGVLDAKMQHVETRLCAISKQQAEFKSSWDQVDGGKKTAIYLLTLFGGIAGAIGGAAGWLWSHIKF